MGGAAVRRPQAAQGPTSSTRPAPQAGQSVLVTDVGFKFGMIIGEVCADLALGVAPMVDGVVERMDPANLPRYPCKQTYRGVPGGARASLQLGQRSA